MYLVKMPLESIYLDSKGIFKSLKVNINYFKISPSKWNLSFKYFLKVPIEEESNVSIGKILLSSSLIIPSNKSMINFLKDKCLKQL